MFTEPKILIIGAGAAGIAAAVKLLEKGLQNIVILEASDRIGGRIHTVEFSDNVIELGAQWVHGERGNVVFDLASSYNLLDSSKNLHDFSKYIFATPKGEILPKEQSFEALKIYFEIADQGTEILKNVTGSYGEYFCNEFYKILKENPFTSHEQAEYFLDWMHKFDNSIQCSNSWFDVSATRLADYWQCDGDLLLNWRDHGYKTLFDLLMQKIPDSKKVLPVMEKIEFNKEVSLIDYTSHNDIKINTTDGSNYTASHVIFTASLGVLKEKYQTMFVPSLPEIKQQAIKGLSIGTANKIFLEFPHQWWEENCAGFSLVWTKEEEKEFVKCHGQDNRWLCDVFQLFTVDYQPRVLSAWIVGENARYIETLSDSDVFEGLFFLLETFLGKAYNIPRPDRIIRSKWYTNNNFRGSYTFQSMTSEELNVRPRDLAEPILAIDRKPLVLFAGEATHDHYYSTVHGAVESGFREANRLIEYQRRSASLRQTTNGFDDTIENLRNGLLRKTRIAIIGAGISGLAAAKTLQDAGFQDYLLIEAQEQIGGRILSVQCNGGWIEYGAQFLHGNQSKLAELCYQKQLLSNIECRDGVGIFIRENGLHVDRQLVQEIDDLIRTVLEECENPNNSTIQDNFENIDQVLRSRFKNHLLLSNDSSVIKTIKEEIFDWMIRYLMIDNSCFTLEELSVKHWGKFRFVGGPEYIAFKSGYNSIVKFMEDGLNFQNILLNSAVEFIRWKKNISIVDSCSSVLLTLADKSKILADCVIITCPLGYLKENHEKMFNPPLPKIHRLAINNLGFGLINKIFLDFGESWWKPDSKGFQFLWLRKDSNALPDKSLATWTRDLTGFDVLQDRQGVLLGWVGGRGAYIVETLSEQEIITDCTNLLKYYLKLDNVPAVKKCVRTQWNANKYIRGSYSHISINCDKLNITPNSLAEPIWGNYITQDCVKEVPVLMFAGEATHEHFYSTTHGAYDTGVKQAQRFLQHRVNLQKF